MKKNERSINYAGNVGGIFALFSLFYARLASAKCIPQKRVIALKNVLGRFLAFFWHYKTFFRVFGAKTRKNAFSYPYL